MSENYLGYSSEELESLKAINTAREICQQPKIWNKVVKMYTDRQQELQTFLQHKLSPDTTIVFTGAGSSEFVGNAVSPFLVKNNINTASISTTNIVPDPLSYLKENTKYALVSCARSGNSPESVATCNIFSKLFPDSSQIMVTCNKDGHLAKLASDEKDLLWLLPPETNDKSFAMTSSYTSMVLSNSLIFTSQNQDFNLIDGAKQASIIGEEIISKYFNHLKSLAFQDHKRIIFLGSSCLNGIAQESALKSLELTAGKVVTFYNSFLGFRHGPKSVITHDVNNKAIIFLLMSSDSEYQRKYESDLLKELVTDTTQKTVVVFDQKHDEAISALTEYYFPIIGKGHSNTLPELYSGLNYLILAQIYAFYKSISLNCTPDNPVPTGEVNRVVAGVTIYDYDKNTTE